MKLSSVKKNCDTGNLNRSESTLTAGDIIEEDPAIEQSDEKYLSNPPREVESVLGTSSEADNEFSFNITTARPQLKLFSPPIFKGNPDEDVLDWHDRYERTGT